ncbi:MAG: ABC transporter permease subunit [Anaerolineae bacterium]|nr:ABC transporter permease subunit [Anaerolineae bacterium]NIN98076.1 ABC transporter permease subunit [Anaerolineae bacterium]NIQ81019.1 ABC transporter permease subunit [Anaerolineae bacterium]
MLGVGILILVVLILAATVGVAFVPYHPLEVSPESKLQPPSLAHLMGTDNFGRDMLARVLYGIRLDLRIAFMVAFTALIVGTLVGTFAGYYGGLVDDAVMRFTDVMMAFPSFVLAMAITAMLGNTIPNVVIAIAISYMPFFIRLTRGEVLSARELGYAEAARCVGNPEWRIMYFHLLPNCLTPALVQATLCLGWAVLDAAGLAFLGLGIRPPTPELGVLVGEGAPFIIHGQWWTSVFPGAVIVLLAFGFNLIGDSLRDITAQEER